MLNGNIFRSLRLFHRCSACWLYSSVHTITTTVTTTASTTTATTTSTMAAVAVKEGPQPAPIPGGMTTLDRSAFDVKIPVLSARIPVSKCNIFNQRLRHYALAVPKQKIIVNDPKSTKDNPTKVFLLSHRIKTIEELEPDIRSVIQDNAVEVVKQEVTVGYSQWTVDQILRAAIPSDIQEVVTAFDTVGHIAHMNLRDNLLPYKHVIGEVILDKNTQIKTVVNKLSTIDTTYRFFKMEVIAGEDRTETELKEGGCKFQLDFAKVYWNSRLSREHERIVQLLDKADVVCDMMAGIGPFAVPAAKRIQHVYANDLNPESFKWLEKNLALNKVQGKVDAFNLDGREFIRKLVAELQEPGTTRKPFTHVIMNLPASAVEFLDVFRGLYKGTELPLPTIHCHMFSSAPDLAKDCVARAEAVMQGSIEQYHCYDVRDVSPKKRMMCLTFKLPSGIAYDTDATDGKHRMSDEPDNHRSEKKLKT